MMYLYGEVRPKRSRTRLNFVLQAPRNNLSMNEKYCLWFSCEWELVSTRNIQNDDLCVLFFFCLFVFKGNDDQTLLYCIS